MKKPKRPRLDDQTATAPAQPRVTLAHLPIEILADILLRTCSPPTVLAVSRTCSFLYHSLAQNPNASFIWRGVRKTCAPSPLPDPGELWKSEADYAAFVFSDGVCEVCKKTTRAIYSSFAARIRLCGNWHCRRRFLNESAFAATPALGDFYRSIWVPYAESDSCLFPSKSTIAIWPRLGKALMRMTEWEKYMSDFRAFKEAEQVQTERARGVEPAFLPAAGEEELILKQCRAAKARFPKIMEFSTRLIQWKWEYDLRFQLIKRVNDMWAKSLTASEGWNLEDLLATETFGALLRCKNYLLEEIRMNDVFFLRSGIESELLALQARHKRQKAEKVYKEKLTEVKKIYERMRCGGLSKETPSPNELIVLPPLSVFCTLPFVRTLKGSPDPNALTPNSSTVTNDIQSPLSISLIMADLHTWRVPVEKHLMTLLGYSDGWQSADTRALSPLKRVTARFFCRKCGQGKGKAYQRTLCFDFRGVCLHVCAAQPQTGNEESGKKKATEWRVDVFEKDDKAISVIKTILDLVLVPEELPLASLSLMAMGGAVRCKTCTGWIVMDAETAIGHAHRHDKMEIELFPRLVSGQAPLNRDYDRPVARSRLVFERGKCESLLKPCPSAKKQRKKVEYGCRHCLMVVEDDVFVDAGKVKAMSFDGLRSHVATKHGIQDVRDEDMFSYGCISNDGEGNSSLQ